MSGKFVQQYRTTASALLAIVGKAGQIIVNTTRQSIHVMDEVTPGGYELGRADASNIQEATTEQDGVMTKEQVSNLATVESGLSTEITNRAAADASLSASIASAASAAAAAQSTANGKITKVSSPTNKNIAFLDASGELQDLGFPFFASGTLLKFASALPTGFTLNTSFNDRVDLNTSNAAAVGDTGGNWNNATGLSNGATGGHTLTIAEIPAHDHDTVVPSGQNDGGFDNRFKWGKLPSGGSLTITSGQTGSGDSHTHSGSTISSTSAWRPSYVKTIWASRNA